MSISTARSDLSAPGAPPVGAPERSQQLTAVTPPAAAAPRRVWTVVRWVLLVGFAVMFLYPFVWLLSAAFKPRGEVFDNAIPPHTWVPHNFVEVWNQLPLLSWMYNSIFISVASATLVMVSSSVVAFGFAYFRFPGRNIWFAILLGTMMLPGAVTLIPNYLIWKSLGWLGTTVPLWGAALFGSAFYIFMLRQFFLGLSRDLFEAARVDGASYWGMFWRIAFPLVRPAAIIVWIFEFQAAWNNFQGPLIYLSFGDPSEYTVPLGVSYAMSLFSPTNGGHGDYQYVMVASLLVTVPMLIIFMVAQRHFIEGIAAGSTKG